MFPVAFEMPLAATDPEKVLGLLQVAGSCSFWTPFSYQTDLLVAETAGYTFRDFLRFGGPLWLIYAVMAPSMAYFVAWGNEPWT